MQFTLFAIALAAIVTPSLAIPTQSQANPLIQPRYTCAPTRYLPSPKCKYYNWLYKPCLSTETCHDGECPVEREYDCYVSCCKP
ncbi:uncharacterized protein L3040_008924 [Drepanopeziza brunnea f. sp. 'multigermtubi']|uniref:uncharacterized protein n=1 Tax=Drepanopeziza brunnea f. sp. 'multigermtubi' TaxID=698441 RepID=UPI0023A74815|nr:hypothetical protein L3040_008924 [Drepanopeziza brunnea f. sp. 'multigermtubi']